MANPTFTRFAVTAGLLVAGAIGAGGAEVVVLKDGFVIQGNVAKEMESVAEGGKLINITKAAGFDYIDDGAKTWVFSTHQRDKQDTTGNKIRPEYKGYKNFIEARKGNAPLPGFGEFKGVTEFNDKWRRTLEIRLPGGFFQPVEQQVTYLDPYTCWIVSPTHSWRLAFRTSEMGPEKARKLLATHPELAEKDGKADPLKRVAIARFLKDAGWLQAAKDEVEALQKALPGPYSKEAQEEFDKLQKELDQAVAELVVKETEYALNAGRYQFAGDLIASFPEKTAGGKELDQLAKLRARHETIRQQFTTGKRLLRSLIDDLTGLANVRAGVGAGAGPMAAVWPPKAKLDTQLAALVAAALVVQEELHPDSVGRIEFFVNLAAQTEREKAEGKDPGKTATELLATAVSGWVKGKSGASPLPAAALKLWAAREMVLAYQRAHDLNTRNNVFNNYKKTSPLGMDELAQVISLLPPAEPENLAARTGTPVSPGNGVPPGVFKRTTYATPERQRGVDYFIKLPPEYHHGRAYPVLIAMTHPTIDPEKVLGSLAVEADRHGYILVTPDWSGLFQRGWQWKGEDHDYVTLTLRDVVRHFTVDNDRVFLFGSGDGANAVMDVGASHPDLFAGVLAMGPIPKWQNFFIEYWKNAQKLPMYIVTGELAGGSLENLRRVFERWMPHGFPSLMVVYKGRAMEWYAAEPPQMFDWMGRKKRVNGAATLALGNNPRQPWMIMRQTDNRFYWLGTGQVSALNLVDNLAPGKSIVAAEVQGDISGNRIVARTRGVRSVTFWLSRDMIDWTKPVSVSLNSAVPQGWKPKVLEPDLETLLEDYRDRGDRRMLFLHKLEFQTPP